MLQIKGSKTNKKLPIVLSREEMGSLLDRVRRPQPRMCLSSDGQTWMAARQDYLVPVRA
ncbi:MAG: hypothetical protein OEV08_16365 [Nitrospira sp.]|nr:hypothetical protein [Nitrospira sp.]